MLIGQNRDGDLLQFTIVEGSLRGSSITLSLEFYRARVSGDTDDILYVDLSGGPMFVQGEHFGSTDMMYISPELRLLSDHIIECLSFDSNAETNYSKLLIHLTKNN